MVNARGNTLNTLLSEVGTTGDSVLLGSGAAILDACYSTFRNKVFATGGKTVSSAEKCLVCL